MHVPCRIPPAMANIVGPTLILNLCYPCMFYRSYYQKWQQVYGRKYCIFLLKSHINATFSKLQGVVDLEFDVTTGGSQPLNLIRQ